MLPIANNIKAIIKDKIPEGLVVAEHTDTEHYYRHTGVDELYHSVTTKSGILSSPYLQKWAASMTARFIDSSLIPCVHQHGESLKNYWILEKDKDEVLENAKLAHEDYFHKAGKIGTESHEVIERYVKELIDSPKNHPSIERFYEPPQEDIDTILTITKNAISFLKDYNIIPLACEMKVASVKHKYGGTVDLIALKPRTTRRGNKDCEQHEWMLYSYLKDDSVTHQYEHCFKCDEKRKWELTMIDWKTSNSIHKPEYAMQIAAYKYAFHEMTGLKIKNTFIVKLDKKTPNYTLAAVINTNKAFIAFRNLSKVYEYINFQYKGSIVTVK